jgi:hypothetical protein
MNEIGFTPKSKRGRPVPAPLRNLPPVPPGQSPTPDHIRAARLGANISQKTAAAMIYHPAGTWQSWESGRYPMSPQTWELFSARLAAYLKHDRKEV